VHYTQIPTCEPYLKAIFSGGVKMDKPNIGKMKAEKDVEGLIKALKDEDYYVRERAAEALGKIKGTTAVQPLIQALKDENWGVRWSVAVALGKIKDTTAVEPLTQALKDGYEQVRKQAAVALGKIGDKRALEPLTKALKDKYWKIRSDAAVALGNIKDTTAVEPLIQALEDKNERVRAVVAEAIGKIRGKKADEALAQVRKFPTYWVSIPRPAIPILPVSWPQYCCICLKPVGPSDFYEIRKKETVPDEFIPYNSTEVTMYSVEVKLEIPYCKNCHHKVKKLFGGESQGVSIEVESSRIKLRFRSLPYAKIFREANKDKDLAPWPFRFQYSTVIT
jgi:HEAT repeat protein